MKAFFRWGRGGANREIQKITGICTGRYRERGEMGGDRDRDRETHTHAHRHTHRHT